MNERARVPFALVGVLLLVTSATLSATVGTYDPRESTSVDRTMEGATAETVTALRGAADDAATAAAAAPVTRPSETTAGRALDDDQTFEDALRLRLYLAARDRLEDVSVRRGSVVARASLPPVEPTTDGYRSAIERVHVERAGTDGAALHVEIEGVTLTAVRDGTVVSTVERSPSFVVANPALLLHNRTERYERRTNAAISDPGMARRLTSRLYLIAWARGYAQYGGAPIQNVVGSRHVELATNDALVAEQRSLFGAADPDGHRGVAAAGRRVIVTDALSGVGGDEGWTDPVLEASDRLGADPPTDEPVGTWNARSPDPEITLGVNGTADEAYDDILDGGEGDELTRIIDRVHTVEARIHGEVDRGAVRERTDEEPGSGWEKVEESTVRGVELAESSGRVPHRDGWKTRRGSVFDATVIEKTTHTWANDGERVETESTVERDLRVRVAVVARTEPIDDVPAATLDGELSNAADRAAERALEDAGGLRGAARSAALGEPKNETAEATAEPAVDRDRLVDDLRGRRERTRNVTVSVPAPALGVGRANPPAMLREELASREAELLGRSGTSPSERAGRASRVAYLEAVDARLATAAERYAEVSDGIEDEVTGYLDEERLDGALAAHRMAERGDADDLSDPAGDLSLAVETTPGYLPTKAVSYDRMDLEGDCTVHPLATRNLNVFTSPHAQIAESIVERPPVVGSDRVDLETAAETLAARDGLSAFERRALEREVAAANAHVRCELVAVMVEAGVPERTARATLEKDVTSADEALALANGTTSRQAAATLGGESVSEDQLRTRMDTALEDALQHEAARPSRPVTNEASEFARDRGRGTVEGRLASGIETTTEEGKKQLLGDRMGSLPAGLPVAPVPGFWYATANVWYVETNGTYERFAVRADRGDPSGPITYVRDDRGATLDHRGETRLLGTAERISFHAETAVVVVVPPGANGVGDTDGVADERSSGWVD